MPWDWKNLRCLTDIAVYFGNVRDKHMVSYYVADRSMSVPMTSSDLVRRNLRGQFFDGFYIRSKRLTSNDQIWHGNRCRERPVLGGQPHPHMLRTQSPKIPEFWDPTYANSVTQSDQIQSIPENWKVWRHAHSYRQWHNVTDRHGRDRQEGQNNLPDNLTYGWGFPSGSASRVKQTDIV